MVGIVQPKADPWCCLHFTKYKFNVYRKKYIRSGRDSAVVGIVGKSKSLDFLKMLIFWSLVRNSVVLAVYLLFSVACFLTVHEHYNKVTNAAQKDFFNYAFAEESEKKHLFFPKMRRMQKKILKQILKSAPIAKIKKS